MSEVPQKLKQIILSDQAVPIAGTCSPESVVERRGETTTPETRDEARDLQWQPGQWHRAT